MPILDDMTPDKCDIEQFWKGVAGTAEPDEEWVSGFCNGVMYYFVKNCCDNDHTEMIPEDAAVH